MTEAEWLACTDPAPMLAFLAGKASGRQIRLFACACCRRVWGSLNSALVRNAVEAAEGYADGLVGEEEIRRLEGQVWRVGPLAVRNAVLGAVGGEYPMWSLVAADLECDQALRAALGRGERRLPPDIKQRASRALADLFRDVFANPFRPGALDPAWQTPTVVALAHAAYDERQLPAGTLDPQRLAVLADALEEAGADAAIVAHLRSEGPHVRGCHVVDLVLGKS